MTSANWDKPALEALLAMTRRAMFDFNKVAEEMTLFLTSRGERDISLSQQDCRVAYAKNFLPATSIEPSNQIQEDGGDDDEKLAEINVDEMSFDEIMRVLQQRQDQNDRKKEKIFNRVLQSLGTPSESEVMRESPALSAMRINIIERKRQKEADAAKAVELALAQEERLWIERERERLKQRHDPSSEDAQGINPVLSVPKPHYVEDAIDKVDIPHVGFNIEDLLANDQFNALLEEIEKELESKADDKGTGEASELSEVLAFLEKAASESKNKPKHEYEDSDTAPVMLPPSLATRPSPSQLASQLDDEDDSEFASQEKTRSPAAATAGGVGGGRSSGASSYTNSSSSAGGSWSSGSVSGGGGGAGESKSFSRGAASVDRSHNNSDYAISSSNNTIPGIGEQRPLTSATDSANTPQEGGGASSSSSETAAGSGPSGTITLRKQSSPNKPTDTDTKVKDGSASEDDADDDDDNDSDDDDDWRATRAKLKATANQYNSTIVPGPPPSSSSSSSPSFVGTRITIEEVEEEECESESDLFNPQSSAQQQQQFASLETSSTGTAAAAVEDKEILQVPVAVAENVLSGSLLGRGRSKGDEKKTLIRKL